ncbi:MAG: hypothetical protein GY757_47365 [bacterium]|nr:hypothetical protein [bacterium]
MKKRLLFHSVNFTILCITLFLAVYIYHKMSYASFGYALKVSYEFVLSGAAHFVLISVLTYFLNFLAGFIKYTIEDKYFSIVRYLKELSKLFLVVIMVSFIDFFVFYEARVGRMIYVYFFIIYSLYYLLYFRIRSEKGARGIIWMAAASSPEIVETYMKKNKTFRILETDREKEEAGLGALVVYQDGHTNEATSEDLIRNKLAGYTVMELVELIEKESGKIPLDYVNIHWFLEKFDVADRSFFRVNRSFNLLVSILLMIVLFPPGLLVALVHRIFSKGPIFYMQQRQGLHGNTFNMLKFRTMINEAEKNGAQFAGKNDPRITTLGKIMRRVRIDEIPQLFNVLKGDMSMVGPRPEREVFIESLSKEIPYYKLRLLVRPGLTGWAQVNGVYASSHLEDHKEKLEYDLYYIKNRGIFLDFLIQLRTIKTILQASGE